MNRLIALFVVVTLWPAFLKGAEEPKEKHTLKSRIDSILESQVSQGQIPGAVILISSQGKTVFSGAYGYAQKFDHGNRLEENPDKMTVGHLFDIASLTKVVGTTTAVMVLCDRGLLSVDDPVSKYIPEFAAPDKSMITLRHLLTHTSGLKEWYPMYYFASDRNESYRLIASLPLQYKTGTERRYSDLGFVILGQIIETVSGMPLEKFLESSVFQPLGMKNTFYNPLTRSGSLKIAATSDGNPYERRMVTDSTLGYTVTGLDPASWNGWRSYVLRGEVNDGNAWHACRGVSGAAGLFSTAYDINKVVEMLLARGRTGKVQFIKPETVDAFLTPDSFGNGLGWMMDPSNSFMKGAPPYSFGHTGFTGTSIAAVPSLNLSVILLINRQNTGLSKDGLYYDVNPVRKAVFTTVMKYYGNSRQQDKN